MNDNILELGKKLERRKWKEKTAKQRLRTRKKKLFTVSYYRGPPARRMRRS
jgi:hypothetical protein